MGSEWEMKHFWLYVGALGFDPDAGNGSLGLRTEMFDTSYSQMFLTVAYFMFTKLDQNRADESLKNCCYSLFHAVPQFWKNYRRRLKEMADEDESCVLQIPPSVFISPLGPKFIHMFYQLARHVVIKELKNDSVGTDTPFAVKLSPEYMCMADVRHRVAYNKLLTVFQRENFFLQEYEEKAQILIKEINRIESEYAALKMQSCKTEQHDQNKTDRTEKIKKVRSMWTLVIEMLASLKKEKEEVDSILDVLEDCAGQCVLDGANVVFSVPGLLCDRVKSDGYQVTENSIMLCNEVLQNLEANRVKTEQQDPVSTGGSISRKQEDWEVMWKNFLGQCPFNLILDQSPDNYRLWFGTYSGNAGDALSGGSNFEDQWSASHRGMQFTTSDKDHDRFLAGNYASENKGSWWFNRCHAVNLNGRYYRTGKYNGSHDSGVVWSTWHGMWYSLKYSAVKIRAPFFVDSESGDGENGQGS